MRTARVGCLLLMAAPLVAQQDAGRRYGYVRTLEGQATVIAANTGTGTEAEVQRPLLVADRLQVASFSRLEAVLADRSRLRLDADTEVELVALANSADSTDTETWIRLFDGRLQVVVAAAVDSDDALKVETGNATFYLQPEGVFTIAAQGDDWTQVIVRQGYAEIVTSRGSSLVRAGEEARIAGDGWANVEVRTAAAVDAFEAWANELEYRVATARIPWVEDTLSYEAASLEGQGNWLSVEGAVAWRPSVAVSWQPYFQGHWTYTPTGLSWISTEIWGWLPYHYGSWDHHHRYGWLWYPGALFAPAHVHWYWGPTHVGWIPSRYYEHHHHPRFGGRIGLHAGEHHYAHASWGAYDRWIFCPTTALGARNQRDSHGHSAIFRDSRDGFVPRGLIAPDTAGLHRANWRQPGEAQKALHRQALERSYEHSSRPIRSAKSGSNSRPRPGELSSTSSRRLWASRPAAPDVRRRAVPTPRSAERTVSSRSANGGSTLARRPTTPRSTVARPRQASAPRPAGRTLAEPVRRFLDSLRPTHGSPTSTRDRHTATAPRPALSPRRQSVSPQPGSTSTGRTTARRSNAAPASRGVTSRPTAISPRPVPASPPSRAPAARQPANRTNRGSVKGASPGAAARRSPSSSSRRPTGSRASRRD